MFSSVRECQFFFPKCLKHLAPMSSLYKCFICFISYIWHGQAFIFAHFCGYENLFHDFNFYFPDLILRLSIVSCLFAVSDESSVTCLYVPFFATFSIELCLFLIDLQDFFIYFGYYPIFSQFLGCVLFSLWYLWYHTTLLIISFCGCNFLS